MAKATAARKGRDAAPAQPSEESSAVKPPDANRPVHAIRYGGCEAAIWKNQSDGRDFYSVTVRKSWRDGESQWHDTQTFLLDDLPMLAKALNDAHSWIAWQERRKESVHGGER